jgi:hypothetical protein
MTPSATPPPSATATFTPTHSPTATGIVSTPTDSPTPVATGTPVLYPNPVKDPGPIHLATAFDQPHDFVTVRIFTTAFRKVLEKSAQIVPAGPFQMDLDPSDFKGSPANGLYYVVITTPSNRWVSKLLISR